MLEQMALARQVASLGLSARNTAGLKVRQPLARVLVYAGGKRDLDAPFVAIIVDELNVKQFAFVEKASNLVSYRVLPDNQRRTALRRPVPSGARRAWPPRPRRSGCQRSGRSAGSPWKWMANPSHWRPTRSRC